MLPILEVGPQLLELLEVWHTKGKHLTAEHRKRISDALKGRGTHKTASFKGGATGAGTGKSALAKAHPVGSFVHTPHGLKKVTGHTSGYIGVEGGQKKWYRLAELQGVGPRSAVKKPGVAAATTGLATKKKAAEVAGAITGHVDRVPSHTKKVNDSWDALEAHKAAGYGQAYKDLEAKSRAEYKAKGLGYIGSPEDRAIDKAKQAIQNAHSKKAGELLNEYSAAVDARNKASYEADIKAGVKRDKPVTSEDFEAVGHNLKHVPASEFQYSEALRAVQERVAKTGVPEWVRGDNGEGGTRWMHITGDYSIESHQKTFGAMGPTANGAEGSPAGWTSASRSHGLLRELAEARDKNMSLAEYHRALDAHAKAMTAEALKTGGLFVRVSPSSLTRVLNEGGFLTQHDTQPNKDTTQTRKLIEKMLYGYPPDGSRGHPVYGYMSADPDGRITQHTATKGTKKSKSVGDEYTGNDWLDGYGTAAVKLKPEIHSRTTITHGDSADVVWSDKTSSARPVSDPDHTIFSRRATGMTHEERLVLAHTHSPLDHRDGVDGKAADEVGSWGQKGYMEAQFHAQKAGDRAVKPADIAEVVFSVKPPAATLKALKAMGIEWRVIA